jgi:hypothetical protein
MISIAMTLEVYFCALDVYLLRQSVNASLIYTSIAPAAGFSLGCDVSLTTGSRKRDRRVQVRGPWRFLADLTRALNAVACV